MKSLLKYALLSCLVSLFLVDNLAMAQQVRSAPAGRFDRIPTDRAPTDPTGRNNRMPSGLVTRPSGNNQRIPDNITGNKPESPTATPPLRPSPPTPRGAYIEKIDNANGFSSNSPPNGNVVNGNVVRQTTVVRGIPGTVRLPFAISQGLRLGIGATNHPGGGVCVTDVLPDSPGGRAGFEVGDVILEINGTSIRNLQDYSKAVDDSSGRMDTTVVNLNDGRLNRTVELRY